MASAALYPNKWQFWNPFCLWSCSKPNFKGRPHGPFGWIATKNLGNCIKRFYPILCTIYICPSSGSCEPVRRPRPKSWVVDFLPSTGRTFKSCIFCFLWQKNPLKNTNFKKLLQKLRWDRWFLVDIVKMFVKFNLHLELSNVCFLDRWPSTKWYVTFATIFYINFWCSFRWYQLFCSLWQLK